MYDYLLWVNSNKAGKINVVNKYLDTVTPRPDSPFQRRLDATVSKANVWQSSAAA